MKLQDTYKDMQQDIVAKWLKEQTDEYLVKAVEGCPDKDLDPCWRYVVEKAKDFLKGRSGAVEDFVVYKWVKEYFIDYEVREAKKKQENRDFLINNCISEVKSKLQNQTYANFKEELEGYNSELGNPDITDERLSTIKTALDNMKKVEQEIDKKAEQKAFEKRVEDYKAKQKKAPKKEPKKVEEEKPEIKQMSIFDF